MMTTNTTKMTMNGDKALRMCTGAVALGLVLFVTGAEAATLSKLTGGDPGKISF